MLTYMIMNLSVKGIKQTLNVFRFYMSFIKDLQVKHEQNYQTRLADWDMYGNEIIQIFMVQLLISMQVNYKDDDPEVRGDA